MKDKNSKSFLVLVYSNMYFYLSLPVFSHWQGRLDLHAMILGSTRRGAKGGSGEDQGRVHHSNGLPAEGAIREIDLRRVEKLIIRVSRVLCGI